MNGVVGSFVVELVVEGGWRGVKKVDEMTGDEKGRLQEVGRGGRGVCYAVRAAVVFIVSNLGLLPLPCWWGS